MKNHELLQKRNVADRRIIVRPSNIFLLAGVLIFYLGIASYADTSTTYDYSTEGINAPSNYGSGTAGASGGAWTDNSKTITDNTYISKQQNPKQTEKPPSPQTTFTQLDKIYGRTMPQALPPTTLDSFVAQSGNNDAIYGDEGEDGPPPYESFTAEHRIERGITSGGLTTGHRSGLPSSWDYPQ